MARRGSYEIADVVNSGVVGVRPETFKQVDFAIVHVIHVEAKREEMRVVAPSQCVRHLIPSLIGVLRPVEKVRHAKDKCTYSSNGNLSGKTQLRNRLARDRILPILKLEVTAILIAELVG